MVIRKFNTFSSDRKRSAIKYKISIGHKNILSDDKQTIYAAILTFGCKKLETRG